MSAEYKFESVWQTAVMKYQDVDTAVTELMNIRAAEGWSVVSASRATAPNVVSVTFTR